MDISARRLNRLTTLTTQAAMAVLTAGLPEFNRTALNDLKDGVELALSDLIESHVSGVAQDEITTPLR